MDEETRTLVKAFALRLAADLEHWSDVEHLYEDDFEKEGRSWHVRVAEDQPDTSVEGQASVTLSFFPVGEDWPDQLAVEAKKPTTVKVSIEVVK